MKNNNTQFDKELHDRLSSEELPFDPMAWEMMEEKLDNEPKRRFIFWIFQHKILLGILSLFLIAAITYWSFHYNNFDDRDHSEVVSISDSKSNTISNKSTTSEISTNTANQSVEKSTTVSEKNVKPSSINTTQNISTPVNTINSKNTKNRTNRKSVIINTIIEKEDSKRNENYITTTTGVNQYLIEKTNTTQITKSEPLDNSTSIAEKIGLTVEEVNVVSTIESLENSSLAYDRGIPSAINIVDIEDKIDRPTSQINMTFGGGMTQLDIDDPFVGDITPTAIINQEMFFSLSYLHRVHRNWGMEVGAQAAAQFQHIAHYFEAGEFDFEVSEYGRTKVTSYEGKYELFSNIHFFLPLNQRSELDIYGGFYALNPLSSPGGWSGGASTRSIYNNNDITLLRTSGSGTSDIFNGGRIKLGVNYNFLTNKLNNVGIGIAYMHEINDVNEGRYSLIQASEEARVSGNLRANPSGFKVQMTYGFGLKKFPWSKKKLRRPSPKAPWYASIRYGTKNYMLSDDLSKELVNQHANKYQSLQIGHYINQKLAFEFGVELSEFTFVSPIEQFAILKNQKLLTTPLALRYDLMQSDRFSFYGKGVFSTDFRITPNWTLFSNEAGLVDENRLLLNAGVEAGIDFRVFSGVNVGVVGKYNQAFSKAAQYQYPELTAQNEVEFTDINLKNTYFSWGVELKYLFNRQKKEDIIQY